MILLLYLQAIAAFIVGGALICWGWWQASVNPNGRSALGLFAIFAGQIPAGYGFYLLFK